MPFSEQYESHTGMQEDFPFIMHPDYLNRSDKFLMHWHENIELLLFTSGRANILCNAVQLHAEQDDLVIIQPYALHSIESVTNQCEYYCLIIDRKFCHQFGLPVDLWPVQNLIQDHHIRQLYENIISENQKQPPYYKAAVRAYAIQLLTQLLRMGKSADPAESKHNSQQLEMVRKAMSYITLHYAQSVSVEDIARAAGYSKYYFCRIFKEITNRTVVAYLKELRCDRARQLICTGACNVSESAEKCGYHNLSYFTRSYKQVFGILPSEARNDAEQKALHSPHYINPCVIRDQNK